MKLLVIWVLILTIAVTYASQERIPIPNKSVEIEEEKIITDPATGEKILYDKILIAFSDKAQRTDQEKVLSSFGGEIVGGIPELGIYQISFENPDASIAKIRSVAKMLNADDNILVAMPQKVGQSKGAKISTTSEGLTERKGAVAFKKNNTKNLSTKSNSIQEVINSHYSGLSACIERQSRINPDFHGKVTFRIKISSQGHVQEAHVVRSSRNDKILTACLLQKIKNWRDFPSRSGSGALQVDFDFRF